MEHSQNFYGLFVVYRYVCVDDIIINFTIVVSIQTCLRFYLVLHRFSYMFIDHFVLLKWLSIQHNFFTLTIACFFFQVIRLIFFAICYLAKFTSTNLA